MKARTIESPGLGAGAESASREPSGARPYWNPWVAGLLLGLFLLASYVIAGRGLGATGAFSSIAAWIAGAVSPEHAQANAVHARYLSEGAPLLAWLVFLVMGAFVGAAISGALAGRTKLTIEKGPSISSGQRIAFAFGGGILAGVGAKIAKGCTSGQALTGGAILNVGSLVFLVAVFAAGFAVAWMMKKEWL